MIPRYARPQMTAIWSAENRFAIWHEIEVSAVEAMAQIGQVPADAARKIRETPVPFNEKRITEIEDLVKHDVIAFLTYLSEIIGEDARFIHQGMTSSDVLDTCLSLQLSQAADLLLKDLDDVCATLEKQAYAHQYVLTIGRSHGIHAEPMTFGLKLAQAHAEFSRNRARLRFAKEDVATCAISGAVGTFANIDPRIEAYVAEKLGLKVEPLSTQVIPRDRHAMFFATLAVIASSVERLSVEIRHLQRTEVAEAEEYFSPGQKGSSAMPHKRNPILSENLTGLARIVRGYAIPALENVALWHERDISHSSVERIIAPDATVTLDFALSRLNQLLRDLVTHPETMKKNLNAYGGIVHSQRILLALIQKGLSREDSYRIVQRNAMKAFQEKGDFIANITADPEISKLLPKDEITALTSLDYHTKHIDMLFKRVFAQ